MQQRILPLQKGRNFRELGGYQTRSGQTVKWQKVIRSANLAHLTPDDLAFLGEYGLKTDVDFRSPDEKSAAPDRLPQTTEYEFLPVFAYDETANSETQEEQFKHFSQSADSGRKRMLQVYDDMINQAHAKAAYRRFFEILLANDQPDQSVLFHCSAGKDRTGMGAVFFLAALDVPDDVIQQDYLLTNTASADYIDQYLAEVKQKTSNQAILQSVHALLTVNLDYLTAAQTEIHKTAGSLQNYLQTDLHLTNHDLKDLRQIYLD